MAHSAVTDQSEDTLTDAENIKLLCNFPIKDSENEGCCKNDVIVTFGSYDEDLKETGKDTIVRKRRKSSVALGEENSIDSTTLRQKTKL